MKNKANYIMFVAVIWMVLGFIAIHEAPAATEDFKLMASDAADSDSFGNSVSVSGDVIVVGAYYDDDVVSNSGSAYVYRFNEVAGQWTQEDKLTASDAAKLDNFGRSVSVSGDVIVVGAIRDDDDGEESGSAYVYRYNATTGQWDEEDKLTASDAAAGDWFGISVSVSGDVIVVGAVSDDFPTNRDPDAENVGSAYVYRYNTLTGQWDEEDKLTASDAASDDGFGFSVSVSGEAIVVGAEYKPFSEQIGSAYVYRYNTVTGQWDEEDKLTASDAASGDRFGRSVSVSGDVIAVGAWGDDDGGSMSGSAYVYRFNEVTEQWNQEDKLTASDAGGSHEFGESVSVNGDIIVVGAMGGYSVPVHSGSAYVYRYNEATEQWNQEDKLTSSDAASADHFGSSVSVSGEVIVVGAEGDDFPTNRDPDAENVGSAYVYHWIQKSDFEVEPIEGVVPLMVHFMDESADGINCRLWDFGDGFKSVHENPIHTYTRPGTYTVSLTIIGPGWFRTETKANLITVTSSTPGDLDGDGIPDDTDNCPESDLSATVVIDECDSGVSNTLLPTGCTISDLIAKCAAKAGNHRQFVRCVSHQTNDLKKDGVITGKQKGAIQRCAAKADIP